MGGALGRGIGDLGEKKGVAAGFKHSSILVVIAVLAAKLVPMFLKFGPGG